MTISEKVAYLRGLAEGLELDTSSKNGKLINGILEALSDIASAISSLEERTDTLDEYIEEIDEDLGEVEEFVYDEDFDDDDDDDLVEVKCPSCGETIVLDTTLDPSSITCPSCNTEFEAVCDCCGGHEDEDEACDCCKSDA